MTASSFEKILPDIQDPISIKRRRWREIKDVVTSSYMAFGGISVIIAILLIFVYLLYVVFPMFLSPEIHRATEYRMPGDAGSASLLVTTEEYAEVGMRLSSERQVSFFSTATGEIRETISLPLGDEARIESVSPAFPGANLLGVGLDNGEALLFRHQYRISYPDDKRHITPYLAYPLGEETVTISSQGQGLKLINAQGSDEEITVAALTDSSQLLLVHFTMEESMLGDEVEINRSEHQIQLAANGIEHLVMNREQSLLFISDNKGYVHYFDISDKDEPELIEKVSVTADDKPITSLSFLAGGISILVGDSSGRISQWFPVRDEHNHYTLKKVREFNDQQAAIVQLAPEPSRKGFAALDAEGVAGIYHTTSGNTLLMQQVTTGKPLLASMAPRANALLVLDDQQQFSQWSIDNEYPEVSWSALWSEVWYESREEPEYIWQSSSASSDFEPKFSLTPLAFGTLKATFYALLFAIPLAIMGAIYTAYFMSPKMRGMVKPTIEIMEALPTVILGFLAGLWLAPLIEENLAGVFMVLMFLPLSMLLMAWCWQKMPAAIRQAIPEGWEAAILVPVVCLTTWLSMSLSQPVEILLFDGDMPAWLNSIGWTFDQRNSLVVGIAMGFAVIPTIFSISEDAIFSVPKHLTQGSLALGATPWQTMIKVVILTASPGIFSGIMIGLGRAVGETMIVLMATGNTPIMDFNIFQGFRALSANIAVEMPESEVGSSHYRILFLAALVLFMVTFVFNTLAELVRQRLRRKYATL